MRKVLKFVILFIVVFIIAFFLLRMLLPSEIDDITPGIQCSNQNNFVMQSKILWVIPDFNGVPISDNKTWCKKILSMNKTLGLHGVMHTYNEFGLGRNQSYLNKGIKIFENCFGFKPTMFKAPQLNISENNIKLIQKNNMTLSGKLNQFTHRVYHCSDTGEFPNWFVKLA